MGMSRGKKKMEADSLLWNRATNLGKVIPDQALTTIPKLRGENDIGGKRVLEGIRVKT